MESILNSSRADWPPHLATNIADITLSFAESCVCKKRALTDKNAGAGGGLRHCTCGGNCAMRSRCPARTNKAALACRRGLGGKRRGTVT